MSRPWFIILALVLIVLGGIALVLIQLFMPGPPIKVGKSTTYLTTPLAADGLPDYAGYLLAEKGQGVTPENNGAIPFLQAMWPAEIEREHQAPLCQHLAMRMPGVDGMTDPSSDKALNQAVLAWLEEQYSAEEPEEEATDQGGTEEGDTSEGEEDDLFADFGSGYEPEISLQDHTWDLLSHAQSHPWKRGDLPLLAEWVDRHQEQYDLLHEAARREKFYLPPADLLVNPEQELISTLLSAIQTLRGAARCLSTRANLHLGEGDAQAAWKDCKAIYHVADWNSHESLVNELVSIAIAGIADGLLLEILNSDDLTLAVAKEILAFQQARPPRSSMADTLDGGERLMFVTAIIAVAGERGDGSFDIDDLTYEDMPPLKNVAINWNIVLEKGNAWYDRVVAAIKTPGWAQRRQALQRLEAELDAIDAELNSRVPAAVFSRKARSEAVGDMVLGLFTPTIIAAVAAEDRANVMQQLHTVAAALAVHRLREGGYPDMLDQLVPGLLAAPPVDVYGRPLVYRKTDRGYLLYSLGENGIDEKGSHSLHGKFEGYDVGDGSEGPIRELLKLPPLEENSEGVVELSGEALGDPAKLPLSSQIPESADDFSLRLPLPKYTLPLPPGE